MNSNTKKAAELLHKENYTFTAVSDNEVFTSYEKGVKPLLKLLDSGISLKEYSVADKVIGKAAAFLYILLGVNEIYTDVISQPALNVLTKGNIKIEYLKLVQAIQNRDKTGFCPMETAVMHTNNADEALMNIRITMELLNKKDF